MKIYSHSLQGKRDSNEDQHVHIMNLNGENKEQNSINFLGVFDGHGGKKVSKYLKDNLPISFCMLLISSRFDVKSFSNDKRTACNSVSDCKTRSCCA